jgi:hypothetical protein
MIKLSKEVKDQLLETASSSHVYLEGNILKLIDPENDEVFKEYLKDAVENDRNNRKKRLEVTKQIQSQNTELTNAQLENENLMKEITEALQKAEDAKKNVENDLDLLQKRVQTELIGIIVKVALWIVIGVGGISTLLYFTALLLNKDTKILESAWINMFGILLTNSFSIIGTIMGVKYASEKN